MSSLLPSTVGQPSAQVTVSAGRPAPVHSKLALVPAISAQRHRGLPSGFGAGIVVVAGDPGTAPGALVLQLLDDPHFPMPLTAIGGTWVVLRSGLQSRAVAHIPGGRRGRTIDLEAGNQTSAWSSGWGRPARRIDLECQSGVLNSVSLAGAPEVTPGSCEADILLDALEGAVGLVYVTTADPLGPGQLGLLRGALRRSGRLAVVVNTADRTVLAANRSAALEAEPELAPASWYLAAESPSLRSDLRAWASAIQLAMGAPRSPAGQIRAPAVSEDNQHWQAVLRRELDAARTAAREQLEAECHRIGELCLRELSGQSDCCAVPDLLDRQLHGLSVRISHRIELGAHQVTTAVLTALLGRPADPQVSSQMLRVVRQTLENADDPVQQHALMLTMTTAIARVMGRAALDSLTVLGLPAVPSTMFPPVAVAVNCGCYQLWQRRDPHGLARCRTWLPRAVHRVAQVVTTDIDRRYRDLEQALETVAADAVDHGFLLL